MHNRFPVITMVFVTLLVPILFNLRGQAALPIVSDQAADTKVDIEGYLYAQLRANGQIEDAKLPISIYVQKIQGRKLVNAVFKRKDVDGEIDYVARARSAELTVLEGGKQVRVHMHQAEVRSKNDSQASFVDKVFVFDLPKDFGQK